MQSGTRRILFFVCLAIATGHNASGQQPFVPAPHRPLPVALRQTTKWHSPAVPRSQVGGFWRTDANFQSAIYLRNEVKTSAITVSPILYVSNGIRIALPDVKLQPTDTAVVDINAALQSQGIAAWATLSGYVEIDYTWPWDALCVTVRNIDPIHSELFNYGLSPGPKSSSTGQATPAAQTNTVEGLWWKHETNVTGFVAVANVTGQTVHARLEALDRGAGRLGQHPLALQPHQTALLNLAELQAASTSDGGIRVTWQGQGDELAINGGMEDPVSGYSASIPFRLVPRSTPNATLRTYAELGLMVGAADPMMRFPAGTTFTPYSVLRNASAQSITATPTVYWMQRGGPKSALLSPVTVAPYHSLKLDVPSLLAAAGLKSFNGEVNLTFAVQGPARQLLLSAGSVDQTGTYVFAVTPMAILESVGKSLSYWSTGNGDDTMVTLWNPADEAQDFIFRLFFTGGQYEVPLHLGPRATSMLNLSEIVNSGVADAKENRIPQGIHEGSAELTGSQGESQYILVGMDSGTYNVLKATCGTYCETCQGATEYWVDPEPWSIGGGHNLQLALTIQSSSGGQYNITSNGSWNTSNPSVATVNVGLVDGVSSGSGLISAGDGSYPDYSSGCYGVLLECPIECGGGGNGPGNVIPVLEAPESVLWYLGHGNNPGAPFFGSVQATVTAEYASGGSFQWSISNAADLSFSSSSSVTQTTTSANSVTVYAYGPGQSEDDVDVSLTWTPTSGPVETAAPLSFTVDYPYSLSLLSTMGPLATGASCTGTPPPSGTVGNYSQYFWQWNSYFGNDPSGLPLNENFTNVVPYPGTNVLPVPNGSPGQNGVKTFADNYCFANQTAAHPPSMAPQSPLGKGAILIWTATQIYSLGSVNIGSGVAVQSQTTQRYQDHTAVSGITR